VVAGKRRSNGVHTPAQKSLINMIWILLFFHCPIIMIGPGGLLLVVPHLLTVPVSVLWVGLQKST
jgi:vacuolar-type H+-ATPase subunit I/STV1